MIEIVAVEGMPEIGPGDEIAALICERADLRDRDVVVVTQKIVSKAEGRVEQLTGDEDTARRELVERESVRAEIVRPPAEDLFR